MTGIPGPGTQGPVQDPVQDPFEQALDERARAREEGQEMLDQAVDSFFKQRQWQREVEKAQTLTPIEYGSVWVGEMARRVLDLSIETISGGLELASYDPFRGEQNIQDLPRDYWGVAESLGLVDAQEAAILRTAPKEMLEASEEDLEKTSPLVAGAVKRVRQAGMFGAEIVPYIGFGAPKMVIHAGAKGGATILGRASSAVSRRVLKRAGVADDAIEAALREGRVMAELAKKHPGLATGVGRALEKIGMTPAQVAGASTGFALHGFLSEDRSMEHRAETALHAAITAPIFHLMSGVGGAAQRGLAAKGAAKPVALGAGSLLEGLGFTGMMIAQDPHMQELAARAMEGDGDAWAELGASVVGQAGALMAFKWRLPLDSYQNWRSRVPTTENRLPTRVQAQEVRTGRQGPEVSPEMDAATAPLFRAGAEVRGEITREGVPLEIPGHEGVLRVRAPDDITVDPVLHDRIMRPEIPGEQVEPVRLRGEEAVRFTDRLAHRLLQTRIFADVVFEQRGYERFERGLWLDRDSNRLWTIDMGYHAVSRPVERPAEGRLWTDEGRARVQRRGEPMPEPLSAIRDLFGQMEQSGLDPEVAATGRSAVDLAHHGPQGSPRVQAVREVLQGIAEAPVIETLNSRSAAILAYELGSVAAGTQQPQAALANLLGAQGQPGALAREAEVRMTEEEIEAETAGPEPSPLREHEAALTPEQAARPEAEPPGRPEVEPTKPTERLPEAEARGEVQGPPVDYTRLEPKQRRQAARDFITTQRVLEEGELPGPTEIARQFGIDRKTASRYLRQIGRNLPDKEGGFITVPTSAEIKRAIGRAGERALDISALRRWFEEVTERVSRQGGEVGQRFARRARRVVQGTRELQSELELEFDRELRRMGRPGPATSELAKVVEGPRGIHETVFQQAVEGRYEGRLSDKAQRIVDAYRRVFRRTGEIGQEAGVIQQLPYHPTEAEKAEARASGKKLPRATYRIFRPSRTPRHERHPTSEARDALDRGEGEVFDAIVRDVARANQMPEKAVRQALQREQTLDEGGRRPVEIESAMERVRQFEHFPTHVEADGRMVEVLRSSPLESTLAVIGSTAHRVPFIREFGQNLPRSVYQKLGLERPQILREQMQEFVDIGGETSRALDLGRALQGLPLDRVWGESRAPMRWWGKAESLRRILALPRAALPNAVEWIGTSAAYAGFWPSMKALARMGASPFEARRWAREQGAVHERILDMTWRYGNRWNAMANAVAKVILYPFRVANEYSAIHSALSADAMVRRWRDTGRGGMLDRRALEFTQFSETEINNMLTGRGTDSQYRDFVRRFTARMTGTEAAAAEKSPLASSRAFNAFFPFQTFFMGKARQAADHLSAMHRTSLAVSEAGPGEIALARQRSAQAKLAAARWLVGNTLAGTLAQILGSTLSHGPEDALKVWWREMTYDPLGTLGTALGSGTIGGTLGTGVGVISGTLFDEGATWESVMGRATRVVAPVHWVSEGIRVATEDGPYRDRTLGEKLGVFAERHVSGLRDLDFVSVLAGAQDDPALNSAQILHWRTLREIGASFGSAGRTPEEDETFAIALRQARDAIRNGVPWTDPEVRKTLEPALEAEGPQAVARSLRARLFFGSTWNGLSPEQKADYYKLMDRRDIQMLMGVDGIMRRVAEHYANKAGTTQIDAQQWGDRLTMAATLAANGEPSAWSELMEETLDVMAERMIRGAPLGTEHEELAAQMARHPDTIERALTDPTWEVAQDLRMGDLQSFLRADMIRRAEARARSRARGREEYRAQQEEDR